ncbi:transmembrane reductase CYB561D2-like [Hydractinia symbiolongicarpus]|uniref:transmembrane reductase CYB561D2-like n=1 Tax=Hydractinia symbiolongicarpus TaxID=13093 RepID=UPI00255157B7|nr:transmembrane reductase CYB561D2-like [Hydractinia symbiolongicarpus]
MAHFFAVLLCVYVLYLSQPGTSLFSWHPTFMVIGFGLFMFEAILMFSPHSSFLQSADRKTKGKFHWILQICAVVCLHLGFSAIYYNKVQNNKPHFVSWHGKVGLIAVALATFQSMAGFSLIYNLSFLNPMGTSLAIRKKMHALFGTVVFVLGCAALFLSLYSNFVLNNAGTVTWYILLGLITVMVSVVVNQTADVYMFKKKSST